MRENPLLTVVTGNPVASPSARRARLAARWRCFHQADDVRARELEIPDVPGAPDQVVALGVVRWIGFAASHPSPAEERRIEELEPDPWPMLVTDADVGDLWIVAPYQLELPAEVDGRSVRGIVYEPPASTGKPRGPYVHAFARPRPRLRFVGGPPSRAAALDGGRYRVEDWIYD